jgi:hypothetical protein
MLTRRAMLTSTPALALAVATPAAAIACSMPLSGGDDSTLFGFLAGYREAQADLAKVISELDWLAAEWKHLWPLAPEELLGVPWGDRLGPDSGQKAECDIAGYFIRREHATLTKRLSKKFRAEGGVSCFGVETAAEVAKDLARWREDVPVGRTAKSLAVNQKFRRDHIKRLEQKHALAPAYEAETARLRQVSGADAATERFKLFAGASCALSEAVMRQPAATMDGIAAKVDFFVTLPHVVALFDTPEWRNAQSGNILSFGWNLSHDIKRLREKGAVS